MNNDVEILYFTSPTCGPCKSFLPVWEDLKKEFPTAKFARIDVSDENNYPACAKFKIKAVPTVIVGNDDISYITLVGVKPKYTYQDLIRKAFQHVSRFPKNSESGSENLPL